MDKEQTMSMLNCLISDNLTFTTTDSQTGTFTCWDYWHRDYYPYVIHDNYPVYIQQRSQDKGKQAFEIIKMLKDSRFLKLETVGDFIDLMDKLIKIL